MPELISDATAVGGNGRYRTTAGMELQALHTCVWRGFEFVTIGLEAQPLFVPELPPRYRFAQSTHSWTGRRLDYRWRGGDLRCELRTTLPGPWFTTTGHEIAISAVSGAEIRGFQDLERRGPLRDHLIDSDAGGARLLFCPGSRLPWVVAASQPIREIRVVSHMHYRFVFDQPGAALLIAPLLSERDVPRDREHQRAWLDLVAAPPLYCEEHFRLRGDHCELTSRYPGATRSPLPTFLSLLGERDGLVAGIPPSVRLLHTATGPYAVTKRDAWRCRIATGWQRAQLEPTRAVRGDLAGIPEELTYAGDATWEPGTPMDQCLSLRSWAPVIDQAPAAVQDGLVPLLRVPTARQFKQAVERLVEPASGLRWAQWRSMWAHNGDACYDPDWYNGLGVSGLARAAACQVPALRGQAVQTARACRRERAELIAYAQVFHEWHLCSPFSDPRGWMWNADCCHNLLEGVLGEARLRETVDRDRAGAAELRALAARHAVGLRAAMELPAWLDKLGEHLVHPVALTLRTTRKVTWSPTGGISDRPEAPVVGTMTFDTWRGISLATGATRNNYVLAGTFPEYAALLRDHVDRRRLRALVRDWERNEPERYHDWVEAYIGRDWRERRARGDQEARIQAAVFYHLAPEVALRRLTLGQSADAVEGRWGTPLHLAEQLLLRSGMRLTKNPVGTQRAQR